jgi:hypothetical protein
VPDDTPAVEPFGVALAATWWAAVDDVAAAFALLDELEDVPLPAPLPDPGFEEEPWPEPPLPDWLGVVVGVVEVPVAPPVPVPDPLVPPLPVPPPESSPVPSPPLPEPPPATPPEPRLFEGGGGGAVTGGGWLTTIWTSVDPESPAASVTVKVASYVPPTP